jgi:hypothetical protein
MAGVGLCVAITVDHCDAVAMRLEFAKLLWLRQSNVLARTWCDSHWF